MKGSLRVREKYNITAAEIDSGLQLSSPCLSPRCSPPLQASIIKYIMAPLLLLS
jgi:hypothetical protein